MAPHFKIIHAGSCPVCSPVNISFLCDWTDSAMHVGPIIYVDFGLKHRFLGRKEAVREIDLTVFNSKEAIKDLLSSLWPDINGFRQGSQRLLASLPRI